MLPNREALYGGAARGGKSEALLIAALQYVDVPGYAAILFRRTLQDHKLPGGLIPRSFEWLGDTEAQWNGTDHKWTFPSGATLSFGYLETEQDKYRYKSSAFQYEGFDELTEYTKSQYLYLIGSRLCRPDDMLVPLRVRAGTNPDGIGHDWVKQRFIIEGPKNGKAFVPALLDDNPFVDKEAYEESLNQLDYVTRQQLRYGDWSITASAGKFKREWFEIVDGYPKDARKVRYWDLASTLPKAGEDPDYTAGALVAEKQGVYYVIDIKRRRETPQQIEALIKQTAELDGPTVDIYMEQEPGASGVAVIDYYARQVLIGHAFRAHKTEGSKEVRANPVSSAAESQNVKLVRGPWISDFLDELEIFPQGSHDDQVDAVSGAFAVLRVGAGASMDNVFMFGG